MDFDKQKRAKWRASREGNRTLNLFRDDRIVEVTIYSTVSWLKSSSANDCALISAAARKASVHRI
jgi:hypothetical protein